MSIFTGIVEFPTVRQTASVHPLEKLSNVGLFPGVSACDPVPEHLTREEAKTLRIGRKVLMYGHVRFGYPKQGYRRGALLTVAPPVEGAYIGWRWRREGFAESRWRGESGYFSGTRNVLIVLVKTSLYGPDAFECLPEQLTLKTPRKK